MRHQLASQSTTNKLTAPATWTFELLDPSDPQPSIPPVRYKMLYGIVSYIDYMSVYYG